MTLAERIIAVNPKPGSKSPEPPFIAPRLTTSVFQVDHRGELIKELRADADELDKRAARQTAHSP